MQQTHIGLYDCYIVSNMQVATNIYEVVLLAGTLAQTIRPGQFLELAVPGSETQLVRVPLSYSQVDAHAGMIYITYAVVGSATKRLSQLPVKTKLNVLGPCGHGWQVPQSTKPALLIAGGVGAPPIIAAASLLHEHGIVCDVILGAQTKDKLWGASQVSAAGARELFISTDDGSCGVKGFTTSVAKRLLDERSYGTFFTCGPAPMMKGVAALAAEYNIACQASLERMMTCGFGVCNTCNVAMAQGGYKGCCTAGPVFDAKEVAW